MIYITGDTHGRFGRIEDFCKKFNTTKDDVMIILGDAGLNFFNNRTDYKHKRELQLLPIKIFCIHGNHEIRPQNLPQYKEISFWGGSAYVEDAFPDIVFAKDNEIYNIPTLIGIKKTFVFGGAYSVDKYFRMAHYLLYHPELCSDSTLGLVLDFVNSRYDCPEFAAARKELEKIVDNNNLYDKCGWWKDEQPSDEIKQAAIEKLESVNWKVDYVFTHTCPLKYEPVEAFIGGINQNAIDKSTEEFLDTIYDRITCKKWYCGHYHIDKNIDNVKLMFESYDSLEGV